MAIHITHNKNKKILIYTAIAVLTLLSIFCFNDKDCRDIVNWAKYFLDTLIDGKLTSFAVYCNDMGLPNNYSIFSNILCALLIAPVYIIDVIIGNVDVIVYCTFLKIIIAGINVIIAMMLCKICDKLSIAVDREIVYLLWFSFNLVQMKSIGNGQIDCIGILLMLIALYLFLEERYLAFSIVGGLSICFKAFPVILIVCLLSYLFANKGIKAIGHALLVCVIPLLQELIERFVFIDYDICERVGFEYSNINFINRIFAGNVNIVISLPIALAVLLVIMIYVLRRNNLIKIIDVLAITSIIFAVFFLLVWSHCQWYLYMLPLLLIIGLYAGLSTEFLLISIGFNVSQMIFNSVSTLYMRHSLLGIILKSEGEFDYNIMFSNIGHIGEIAASIFFGCMLAMILYYVIKRVANIRNVKPLREQNHLTNGILLWVLYATTFISESLFLIMYITE